MEFYRVGGAVRDRLLGQSVKENDYVVVGASPEKLLMQGFIQVGKDFPVFLHPKTHEEYALARTERKEGRGYTGFSVYASPEVTLLEDLKRRDLTMNAIAETSQGEIIDPYKGCHDIKARILRHVSPAFREDPVRILRVARFMARFASLGFKTAPETLTLMRIMVKNEEVNALIPERIWREFEKALAEPNPTEFVMSLDQCGAWICLCPEWKQVAPERHQQALQTLAIASTLTKDTRVRFASLMQFIALSSKDTRPLYNLARRWRLPKAYRDLLVLSVRHREEIHKVNDFKAEQILNLLEQADAMRRQERFEQLLMVCEADWKGQYPNQKYDLQRETIFSAMDSLRAIKVSALIESGLQGVRLSQALRKLRIITLETELKKEA